MTLYAPFHHRRLAKERRQRYYAIIIVVLIIIVLLITFTLHFHDQEPKEPITVRPAVYMPYEDPKIVPPTYNYVKGTI